MAMAAIPPIEDARLSTAINTIHAAATRRQSSSQKRPTTDTLLAAIVDAQQRYSGGGFGSVDRSDRYPPRAEFLEALAGGGTPGKRWKLVYVCGKDSVIDARRRWKRLQTPVIAGTGSEENGGGAARPTNVLDPATFGLLRWFPPVLAYGQYIDEFVTAIQRFDLEKSENENGIFEIFGSDLLKFTVIGPFKWPNSATRQVCAFRPTKAKVNIGSLWSWEPSLDGGGAALWSTEPETKAGPVPFHKAKVTELPFFKFILVDDKVAVAQGRSGSVALWARME